MDAVSAACRRPHDSLSGALATAARIGGATGDRLAATAQEAFLNGMHAAVLVAAGIALVGALVALVFLPSREAAPPRSSLRRSAA